MKFDPHSCWDCPLTLAEVLGQFAIFLAVAFVGPWLLRRRAVVFRAFGAVALPITSFLVVLMPIYVPRWGVFRLGSETALYPGSAIRLACIVFVGVFFLVGIRAYRRAGHSAI
jgi:hypothetical protein